MLSKNRSKVFFFITFFLIINLSVSAQSDSWIDQVYNPDVPKIELNPMKGLMSGYFQHRDNDFPYSVEHFYIKLNDVVKAEGVYDWSAFEDLLEEKTEGGRHVICRFWTYYPGHKFTTGVPQYLIDQGLTMYNESSTDNSCPDWNDQRLLDLFLEFIPKFAAKYDGDPRILMIEAGLYGSWGEWNISSAPAGVEQMSFAKRDQIANAYIDEFSITHIGLRRANRVTSNVDRMALGYYDDSWGRNTLCSGDQCSYGGNLLPLDLTENYKYHPFGGEIRPQNQSTMYKTWAPNPTISEEDGGRIEDIIECVEKTHASFFKSHYLYKDPSNSYSAVVKANALKLQKMLGYEFFVKSVSLTVGSSNDLTIKVKIKNKGVAPIYYNWDVEFLAISNSDVSTNLGTTDWDLTKLLPKEQTNAEPIEYLRTFSTNLPNNDTYKILMRFVNPLENEGYAETMQLRFANEKQDIDRNGWLTLGSIDNTETLGVNDNENYNMKLYPNPTKNTFHISIEGDYEFSLISASGKEIMNKTNLTGLSSINIKSISTGLYYIKIKTDNKYIVKKVIIE